MPQVVHSTKVAPTAYCRGGVNRGVRCCCKLAVRVGSFPVLVCASARFSHYIQIMQSDVRVPGLFVVFGGDWEGARGGNQAIRVQLHRPVWGGCGVERDTGYNMIQAVLVCGCAVVVCDLTSISWCTVLFWSQYCIHPHVP